MNKQEAIEFFSNEIQCLDTDSMFYEIDGTFKQACEWALYALQQLEDERGAHDIH